jgi:hypothetical protein
MISNSITTSAPVDKQCRVFSIHGISGNHPSCWEDPKLCQELSVTKLNYDVSRILDDDTSAGVFKSEAETLLNRMLSSVDAGPVRALPNPPYWNMESSKSDQLSRAAGQYANCGLCLRPWRDDPEAGTDSTLLYLPRWTCG